VAGGSGGSMTTEHEREQEERRQYLENEKLLREKSAGHGTYFSHACADADAIGGRFSAVGKAYVTGSSPTQTILPAPSWAGQDNGVEPPLGYEIDWVEPVGSLAEQAEAQRILDQREAAAHSPAATGADVALSAATGSLAVGEPIATSALQSNSSGVGISPATGEQVHEALGASSPPLSNPLEALQTTPAVRGPASNEQRFVAGPRSFRRL
jgi:hypothetical protein